MHSGLRIPNVAPRPLSLVYWLGRLVPCWLLACACLLIWSRLTICYSLLERAKTAAAFLRLSTLISLLLEFRESTASLDSTEADKQSVQAPICLQPCREADQLKFLALGGASR